MKRTFIYRSKEYPWIKTGEGSNAWEDGTKSCTDLEEQIEIIKFIKSVEGNNRQS